MTGTIIFGIITIILIIILKIVLEKTTPTIKNKRKVHKLKLKLQYCDDVYNLYKRMEIRKNDRNYQIGDIIKFIPWDNDMIVEHKISKCTFQITDILDNIEDKQGTVIREDYVILSIAPCTYTFKD